MMQNYYQILGVDSFATAEQIKKVYKQQAIKFHPDKNHGSKESEEKFKEINLAYEILSNEEKRKKYDASLKQKPITPHQPKPTYQKTQYRSSIDLNKFMFSILIIILAILAISDTKTKVARASQN